MNERRRARLRPTAWTTLLLNETPCQLCGDMTNGALAPAKVLSVNLWWSIWTRDLQAGANARPQPRRLPMPWDV